MAKAKVAGSLSEVFSSGCVEGDYRGGWYQNDGESSRTLETYDRHPQSVASPSFETLGQKIGPE